MAQLGQVVDEIEDGRRRAALGIPVSDPRARLAGGCERGGFQSERDAGEALERALERLRRANGTATTLTLATLVKEYLAQHDAQPETVEKLRWLLAKAVAEFGDRPLGALRSQEIAAWDDDRRRPPFRGDASTPAGAGPRGRLRNDRRQPGQAGRRQPAAADEPRNVLSSRGRNSLRWPPN